MLVYGFVPECLSVYMYVCVTYARVYARAHALPWKAYLRLEPTGHMQRDMSPLTSPHAQQAQWARQHPVLDDQLLRKEYSVHGGHAAARKHCDEGPTRGAHHFDLRNRA